jgi:hypothetical protein
MDTTPIRMKSKFTAVLALCFLLLIGQMGFYYRQTGHILYLVLAVLSGAIGILCAWLAYRLLGQEIYRAMHSPKPAHTGSDEDRGRLTWNDASFQIALGGQKARLPWDSVQTLAFIKQADFVLPRVALVMDTTEAILTLPEDVENFQGLLEEIRIRLGVFAAAYYLRFVDGDEDHWIFWEKGKEEKQNGP